MHWSPTPGPPSLPTPVALPSFLLHHHHTPAFFTHYLRDARQAFGTKQDPSPLQPATFKTPQIKVMRQTEEAHTDSRTVLTLSSNDISGEEEHWQSMLSSGAGLQVPSGRGASTGKALWSPSPQQGSLRLNLPAELCPSLERERPSFPGTTGAGGCQKVPSHPPPPPPPASRFPVSFLFSSACHAVGEAWRVWFMLPVTECCFTQEGTGGHTLFLIKTTISVETSLCDLFI